MKKYLAIPLAGLMLLTTLSACGSVSFSGGNSAQTATPQNDANTQNAQTSVPDTSTVQDCDTYMKEFAESCAQMTIYDESGELRNDIDANGNILGPVDQGWAVDYCNCFAQMAFQTYGCQTVHTDESLSDNEWIGKYSSVQEQCAQIVTNTGNTGDAASAATGDASGTATLLIEDSPASSDDNLFNTPSASIAE